MKTLHLSMAAAALLAAGAANAASLLVRPTAVILSRGEAAAQITLTNSGTAPITAQVRVFRWDQASNEDQLTATNDVAASPPMMTIPAGQSQTIRLVRTQQAAASKEETYRILVDEIADRAAATSSGVQIQLRYSVPVFVMPNPSDTAQVSITADVAGDALTIKAANHGRSHAQVTNVSLRYADGSARVVNGGLVGYVLPDKDRQWRLELPDGTPPQPQAVRAVVNGKELVFKL